MTSETTLLSDQVFQLNAFLWALEDLPASGKIRPALRDAGYFLMAVGRRLLVPADFPVVDALERLTGSADRSPCHPDLWLKHSEHPAQVVAELKAQGFSADSTNSRQALKLLVSAFDLAISLGESTEHRGHVVYGTASTDATELATTLKQLADDVRAEGVPSAPTAVVGLSVDEEGVALSSPEPSDLPGPAAEALVTPSIVFHRDGKNDLTPLYFIPWIPGIDDTQDPALRADGLRELTARVLTEAQRHVGRAEVPRTLSLHSDDLLRGATFGMFDRWRDRDRSQFTKTAIDIVQKAIKSHVDVRREGAHRLEVDLPSSATKDKVIKRLDRADPADPTKNLDAATREHPRLFDDF
ncbi:MAG: hypothetical protein OXS29_16075 [bacterium]|nr:hypothetical protein [bacterium]MDE0290788.1 hypothetical protein [bacterium]MDE0438167.1 hypothetical protein [bacterium]